MIHVKLTPAEMMLGAQVGCLRHIAAVKAGRADKYGAEKGGWQLHIEGALGELAFARATGRYWSGSINSFSDPDVGDDIQVRTRSLPGYELIVRPKDSGGHRFVLVTGVAPDYDVRGWILGADAKREQWVHTHGGRDMAWFVPHANLKPMEELR